MADEPSSDTPAAGMNIDPALVRELALLLTETGLTEIEVEDGKRKIRVGRKPAPTMVAAPMAQPAPHAPAMPAGTVPTAAASPAPSAAPAATPADDANTVKSPMVGTAYLAAEPGAAPFARVGDSVKAGQTLLIIEAMKVMNPITAPHAGTVQAMLVENAQPVEFDQPLVILS